MDSVEAEELALLPGLDEVFALAEIARCAEDPRWDTVVVDCAPTAETLRVLALPEVLSFYGDRIAWPGRLLTRAVSPLLRRITDLPLPTSNTRDALESLFGELEGIRRVLTDPTRTRVRVVTTTEQMVVAEARRLTTYLSLYGYPVDAVVLNRLLPDTVEDPFFSRWKEMQVAQRAAVAEGFDPVPVLPLDMADHEPVGADALARLGEELYGGGDPTTLDPVAPPLSITRIEDGYVLAIDLPFAQRSDVDVGRRRSELFVTVGPHRRRIVLPDSLRRRTVVGATMRDGALLVRFADPPPPTMS